MGELGAHHDVLLLESLLKPFAVPCPPGAVEIVGRPTTSSSLAGPPPDFPVSRLLKVAIFRVFIATATAHLTYILLARTGFSARSKTCATRRATRLGCA